MVEDMQGTPYLIYWVWAIPEKLQTVEFEDIYTFLKKKNRIFLDFSIYP